ncbi:helix-turn-helix domain-containing protein [Streptomyces sp. NPDC087658]|uniref:helix-turn-helix domain-containing protein n=1 Tax=Streptomyces sp. NPDC087658 TaxID=3365800 RepID=UPI0037FBF497
MEAAHALFSECGLSVTAEQVADRAGVGRATVYRSPNAMRRSSGGRSGCWIACGELCPPPTSRPRSACWSTKRCCATSTTVFWDRSSPLLCT